MHTINITTYTKYSGGNWTELTEFMTCFSGSEGAKIA